MFPTLLVVAFLLAHAAIHAAFVSPRPTATAGGPPWPFDLERSWLLGRIGVDPEVARVAGIALVAVTVAGFAAAAIAALGVLPPFVWTAAVTVGVTGSLGLLVLFFHPWLILGVAIDVALVWAVLFAGWDPASRTI
jgi:hypothetical protein